MIVIYWVSWASSGPAVWRAADRAGSPLGSKQLVAFEQGDPILAPELSTGRTQSASTPRQAERDLVFTGHMRCVSRHRLGGWMVGAILTAPSAGEPEHPRRTTRVEGRSGRTGSQRTQAPVSAQNPTTSGWVSRGQSPARRSRRKRTSPQSLSGTSSVRACGVVRNPWLPWRLMSTLAIEYAHRYADTYLMVWWVDAERPGFLPVPARPRGRISATVSAMCSVRQAGWCAATLGQVPAVLTFDSDSSPCTYAVAVRRDSMRPKRPATRPINSLKVISRPAGSTVSATAITRSSDVFTNSG
jgi:hypothetical protein